MSTKIKALNEEEPSFEADPETPGKISKEAQEELSILKYNQALKTLKEGRKKDAVEILEELVVDPYIFSRDDLKQLSLPQQKLQLGCLKILGDLYRDGEYKNLERCKIMYERAIYYDQNEKDNVNFWYRLGKVCFEMGDLYSAQMAFGHALSLRPGHWNCLEHIVTVSFAIQDYTSCLDYCTSGLSLDSGFFKGRVFRDLVFQIFPELDKCGGDKVEPQPFQKTIPKGQQDIWRERYLQELQNLQCRSRQRRGDLHKQIIIPTPKIHLNLKSFSLVELVRGIVQAYEKLFGTAEFHKVAELTWSLGVHGDGSGMEVDECLKQPVTTEESQTGGEEESQSAAVLRTSRSSSDDKDSGSTANTSIQAGGAGDSTSQLEGGDGGENRENGCGGEGSQQQNAEGQGQASGDKEEGGNKKKNKRDVKWWQMEGKRRSQRVRGHLLPTSPDKAKKESSFADQLKNLIPAPLLGDDGSTSERESARICCDKSGWQKKFQCNYFGSREEENHVRCLLGKMSGMNVAGIVSRIVGVLANKVKYPWPAELRDLFFRLYHHFRSYVGYPNIQSYGLDHLINDAFACICFVEIVIEKFKGEFSSGEKDFFNLAEKEIFLLEECIMSTSSSPEPVIIPKDLILRVKWMTVRRLLQMSLATNDDQANGAVCEILAEMETELRHSTDPHNPVYWTVNETSNLICLESVSERAVGITKMQNSQVVTDLYQSQQYESLVSVLQSCINFSEIEKRDLLDIYYYSVALFRTNNSDCINHSLNLVNQAIRFQDNNSLAESLVLLEKIWDKMSSQFTLQDKRAMVGSILKIIVSCERKPPSQESIVTVPWCLLHSVLYSLEREEPAFYLEEDTVPNSVLLLQMAHECMSRSEKCCMDSGKLMLYTMKAIVQVKRLEEYFAYEETRLCMEQAIFCLYSHPSKKSKVKNLKDHNSSSTQITWTICPTLYHYYCPTAIPEFDSFDHIGAEVESLFQRLLEIMPPELNPVSKQRKIQTAIEKSQDFQDEEDNGLSEKEPSFLKEVEGIYYLIGDYYFKTKEWSKAVTYYTWDLAVNPTRFDSWAAIALCLGEVINTTLNTADVIHFEDLLKEAQSTSFCFTNALKIQPCNVKLSIEFGSFVYAMHAYCSRLMKLKAADMDMNLFHIIEKSKDEFLKSSFKCFEMIAKNPSGGGSGGGGGGANDSSETVEEELWIHHYMLGKINEKRKEDAEEFLKQYELAGKLLHDQGAPYPSKMNYYSPPELGLEALEIYYRVHASILTLVENTDYSLATERVYLQFIRRQGNGPFIKCKQSKGDGGEGKKGRKATTNVEAASEAVLKKQEMAEIQAVMNDILDQTVKLVNSSSTQVSSAATSTTTTEDETSTDSVKSLVSKPSVSSFSLSEFRKRLQEKEEREEKMATTQDCTKKGDEEEEDQPKPQPPPPSPPKLEEMEVDIYEGLDLNTNNFYEDFKEVKFGAVISLCLKAMEECILRYPSHFKSYYRLAHSYITFLNDAKRAREYLMGSPTLNQRKISGLFGERKPTNFFNGIWRNPIDDIERPGSFSYHMNKSMQLLLDVLSKLNDHQLLADIGIYLTKVPDNEKKYFANPDREMFCQQAWNCSTAAMKKKTQEGSPENINELGVEIFDTYTKFQKHNPRAHGVSGLLYDLYKLLLTSKNVGVETVTVEHALRYFSAQHLAVKQTLSRINNSKATGYGFPSGGDGGDGHPGPRKRGRRAQRQTSQETAPVTTTSSSLPTSQDLDTYGAFAAAFQSGLMDPYKTSPQMLSMSYFGLSQTAMSGYPMMNIDPMQVGITNNPTSVATGLNFSKGAKTPPQAHHDSSRTTIASTSNPTTSQTSGMNLGTNKPSQAHQPNVVQNSSDKTKQPNKQTTSRTATPESSKDSSKYPPPPPVRLNTSPFKAQSTAVEQPPQFSYKKGNQSNSSSVTNQSTNERKNPPAAHSQAKRPTPPTNTTDDDEVSVEVIDLTVKTPEKDKESKERGAHNSQKPKGSSSSGPPTQKTIPNKSNVTISRMSSNSGAGPGNTIINISHNNRPIQNLNTRLVQNPKPVVSNPRTSMPSPITGIRNPIPPAAGPSPRASASSSTPRPAVPSPKSTTLTRPPASSPKTLLDNSPVNLQRTSTNFTSSNVHIGNPGPPQRKLVIVNPPRPIVATTDTNRNPQPRPTTQANPQPRPVPQANPLPPRPTVQGNPQPRPTTSYPLPPKKKHHHLMFSAVPPTQPPPPPPQSSNQPSNNDDDDVENGSKNSSSFPHQPQQY